MLQGHRFSHGGNMHQNLTISLGCITGYSHQAVITSSIQFCLSSLFPHLSASLYFPFLYHMFVHLSWARGFCVSGVFSGVPRPARLSITGQASSQRWYAQACGTSLGVVLGEVCLHKPTGAGLGHILGLLFLPVMLGLGLGSHHLISKDYSFILNNHWAMNGRNSVQGTNMKDLWLNCSSSQNWPTDSFISYCPNVFYNWILHQHKYVDYMKTNAF